MRFLLTFIVSMILAYPSWSSNISVFKDKTNPSDTIRVSFTTQHAINTISDPIKTCAGMQIIWSRGSSSVVSLYATAPSANTVSAVEASTLLHTFTASTNASPVSITPGTPFVRFVVDTAETGSDSVAEVRCSNVIASGSGGGGGAVVVNNMAEVEAAFRAADKPDVKTCNTSGGGPWWCDGDKVSIEIVLGPDFVVDLNSTTPMTFNLPTGGADHPFISIDLGGHEVGSAALKGLVLEYGRTNGVDGTLTPCLNGGTWGFHAEVANCAGVSHDGEVRIFNGMVSNRYKGCDGSVDAVCGRSGIYISHADSLIGLTGAGRSTRLTLGPYLKIGGPTSADLESNFANLELRDDSAVNTDSGLSALWVKGDQLWDSGKGVTVRPLTNEPGFIVGVTRTGGPRINFGSGFEWISRVATGSTFCSICEHKLLDIQLPTTGAIYTFASPKLSGRLGDVRGGTLSGTIESRMPASGSCYSSAASGLDTAYLRSPFTAGDEALTGGLTINGSICTNSLVEASEIGALRIAANISVGAPGFAATDAAKTAGALSPPVLKTAASGAIDAAEFDLRFSPPLITTGMTYSNLADSTTDARLAAAGSKLVIDLGPNGYYYTDGTTHSTAKSTARYGGASTVASLDVLGELNALGYVNIKDTTPFLQFFDTSVPTNGAEVFIDAGQVSANVGRTRWNFETGTDSSWTVGLNVSGTQVAIPPGFMFIGGGTTKACFILGDSDLAGSTSCTFLNGAMACEVDTNSICNDGI